MNVSLGLETKLLGLGFGLGLDYVYKLNFTTVFIVQIGETPNTELDSIIQQVKQIKYKGNIHSANVL